VLRFLFTRRRGLRWPFAVTTVLFAILALMAIEYGAFAPYAWLTVLCLLNLIYPSVIARILFVAALLALLVWPSFG